jgi:hypothetical protein
MVENAEKKMTLRMVAKRLGCSTEWVRKRIDEKSIPVERLSDRHGTLLMGESQIAMLGEPGRRFYKKRSAGKKGADSPASASGKAARWSMRSAVAATVKAAVANGWRPESKADRALADAMFGYLDGSE